VASAEELQDEQRRVRRAQLIVALASNLIMQGHLSRTEGEMVVASARAGILRLFPDRESTYEILYARRFRRLLDEFAEPNGQSDSRQVLPFRPRS
jgi:hypothetical protein